MNRLVEIKANEVIDELIDKGHMFTAFDVTSIVRKELGKSVNVLHKYVKETVQGRYYNNDMNDGGSIQYDRTVITIGLNPCLLYHASTADFSKYNPSWLEDDPEQKNMQSDDDGYSPNTLDIDDVTNSTILPSLNVDNNVQKNDDGSKQVFINSEYRINIPLELIQKANMAPHQAIGVLVENGKIFITKDILNKKCNEILSVNRDGRIRIGKRFLDEILDSKAVLNVKCENSDIVVYV